MSVVTVHLVRHGEHGDFGHRLTGRGAGVGLTQRGREQVHSLANAYADVPIRAILCSPLQRTEETAAILASALQVPVVPEPDILEIELGGWTGRTFDELRPMPDWQAWNTARGLAAPPDGESMVSVQARAMRALLRQRDAGGTILAVTHSDVVKAVIAGILGMPLDLSHRLDIAPASRSIVIFGQDWARVETINLPP